MLFSADRDRTARFYRAIGIDLKREDHDDGPVNYAAELGPVLFAVYSAESACRAPARRGVGSSFPGFLLDSLDATAASLAETAAPVLSEHGRMPRGGLMVFQAPTGASSGSTSATTAPNRTYLAQLHTLWVGWTDACRRRINRS